MQAYNITGRKIVAAIEIFRRSENKGLSSSAKTRVDIYSAVNSVAPRSAMIRFRVFIWQSSFGMHLYVEILR